MCKLGLHIQEEEIRSIIYPGNPQDLLSFSLKISLFNTSTTTYLIMMTWGVAYD